MQKNGILTAVGNTPLVTLQHLWTNPQVPVRVKLEGNNPGGSVKDRPAAWMLRKAIEAGELTPDKIILEPTSGNTGIAIAMIGRALGYHVKLVMPACVSTERRAVLEAYGAELILSAANEATDGAIRLAHEIYQDEPGRYFMPNQYANPNNPLSHFESTGPEIWQQTDGKIAAFVAGMGTSGTLMGVGRYLKDQSDAIQIIGAEPTLGHKLQGLKNMQEAIVPEIYQHQSLDRVETIEDEEAFEMARQLAQKEGIFAGMSGGAAVVAALRTARNLQSGEVVAIIPDRGDRYLSTNLFRSVCANCPP